MKGPFLRVLFFVLLCVEVVSLGLAVSVNGSHGRSESAALGRLIQNPTEENRREFQHEVDELEQRPRLIRRVALAVFCVNTGMIYVTHRKLRVS